MSWWCWLLGRAAWDAAVRTKAIQRGIDPDNLPPGTALSGRWCAGCMESVEVVALPGFPHLVGSTLADLTDPNTFG